MPPVASPDTTCCMRISITFWGEATAAPPPDPPTDVGTFWGGATAAPPPDPPTDVGTFWGGAIAAPPPDPPTDSGTFWGGAIAAPPPDPPTDSKAFLGTCSVAEVGAANRVVPLQIGRGAGHHDAPGFEEVGVVGELERHRGVLLDQQHAHALLLVDGAHDAEDLAGDQGRESERRLVQQQEARARHEGARHRQHLLLPARERARLLPLSLVKDREI